MNEFITWEMLGDFVKLTSITLAATQFLKNVKFVEKISTRYLAWFLAFIFITLTNINTDTFRAMDILLYGLSAMFVSTSASGIYDAGVKKVIDGENTTKTTTVLNEKQK